MDKIHRLGGFGEPLLLATAILVMVLLIIFARRSIRDSVRRRVD